MPSLSVGRIVAIVLFAAALGAPLSDEPVAAVADRLKASVVEDDACAAEGAACSFHALQVQSRKRAQEIKVIGAGHPRTGSQSAQAAFEALGYNSTSGLAFQLVPAVQKVWMDWAEGGSFDGPLQLLLDGGVEATTADWPASAGWKELMQRYPNAKVILFTHPKGAEGWVNSFESAAIYYSCGGVFRPGMFTAWLKFGVHFMHGLAANETASVPIPFTADLRTRLMKGYELDNEEVRKSVPKDKILEYNVAEGWEPLCKFLGKPVPDIPFPHVDTVGGGNLCKVMAGKLKELVLPGAEEKPAAEGKPNA